MERKRQGTLIYDEESGRYDIRFSLERYYGGLHCGECFDVLIGSRWVPTRIEMDDRWYLVGVKTDQLAGLRVRTCQGKHQQHPCGRRACEGQSRAL